MSVILIGLPGVAVLLLAAWRGRVSEPLRACALGVVYAAVLWVQVPVWRSETTLWHHAAGISPLKPRPVLNYARALLLEGHMDAAEQGFYRTLALAGQPHLPSYDRDDAIRAAQANLQTVAIMRAVWALPTQ